MIVHLILEKFTCDPYKYTMGSPVPYLLYQYVWENPSECEG